MTPSVIAHSHDIHLRGLRNPATYACFSGLSGVQDYGDDFCAWQPGQYGLVGTWPDGVLSDFALDAIHNENYRDSGSGGWDNPDAGYGYYDTAYWDEVPAEFRHINMVQIAANGGHRAIEAIKYETDDISSFYSMGPALDLSDFPAYDDCYMRMVFQFSEIFPIDDTEGFTDFLTCRDLGGGFSWRSQLQITKGLGDTEGDLVWKYRFPSGINQGGATVATRAEVFTGAPVEVIMRSQSTGATTARWRVWFGPAFGSLERRVNVSADSADMAWTGKPEFWFYGEVFGADLTSGQQMSCQLIEWEVVNAATYDQPPVWGTRLLDFD